MPFAVADDSTPLGALLLRALDTLEAAGYTFWTMEEIEVEDDYSFLTREGWNILFEALPAELPLLPGEIELLASVLDEILALGSWDQSILKDS